MKCKIDVLEHATVDCQDLDKYFKEFNKYFEAENPKYLGLHQEQEYKDGLFQTVLKSHYYIGYRWLDEENYMHVKPKDHNGDIADYLAIFLECLNNPIVSKKMDDSYEIYFNEKWIEIEEKDDVITPLIILHFLKIVKKISQKGLKKGYIKITENLTSRVKGKILINQTIKQNHFKNRLDKTVCNHQIFTINCIENQIIKTALIQCGRHLQGAANEDISKLLKQNINAFELVESKEVFDNDFSKIKYSLFYKEYKEALELAKMIFKRFGFTLDSNTGDQKYKIPPFHINMPELFERYVEVKLRHEYRNQLIPGYGQKDGNSYSWGLRPDFVVENEKIIIDAKYKYWFEDCNDCIKLKDDFQQLSLYGRVSNIRKKIGLDSNEEAQLVFIYPSHAEKDKEFTITKNDDKLENLFSNIIKIPLYIPNTGKI